MTQHEQHMNAIRFLVLGKLSKTSSSFVYDKNWSNELTFLSAWNGSKSNSHNSIIKETGFSQTLTKATILSCFILERILASFIETLVTSGVVLVWRFLLLLIFQGSILFQLLQRPHFLELKIWYSVKYLTWNM